MGRGHVLLMKSQPFSCTQLPVVNQYLYGRREDPVKDDMKQYAQLF